MSRLHYCTKRVVEYSKTAYFRKLLEPMNNLIHDLCENVCYSDDSMEFAYILKIERVDFEKGLKKLKSYKDEDLPEALIKSGYTKKDVIKFFEDVLKYNDPNDYYVITLEWF